MDRREMIKTSMGVAAMTVLGIPVAAKGAGAVATDKK